MKNMTKDRYNTIGERLLIITLLSTFVCLFVNSYIPLIATGAIFVGFLIFARRRYGYRAVEYRTLRDDEKDDEIDMLSDLMYSHLRGNLFHISDDYNSNHRSYYSNDD